MTATPITWAQVSALAPGVAGVPLAAQNLILPFVETDELDPGAFGGETHPKYVLARIYLAAHLGFMAQQGASAVAGPVVSESAGGLSRSYANLYTSKVGGVWSGSTYADNLAALVMTSPQARLPMVILGRRC